MVNLARKNRIVKAQGGWQNPIPSFLSTEANLNKLPSQHILIKLPLAFILPFPLQASGFSSTAFRCRFCKDRLPVQSLSSFTWRALAGWLGSG